MQRVKWLFYPFLFVLFFLTSLEAIDFKNIVFDSAVAEFLVEESSETQESISNHIQLEVENKQDQNRSSLVFYRYDKNSKTYLNISQTDFLTTDGVIGRVFNSMSPLSLENNKKIDITKKIPLTMSSVFKQKAPLILVFNEGNLTKKDHITLTITTKKDKEVIRLRRNDKNSTIFTGYINTSTKYLYKYDGKLFVEKGNQIKASLSVSKQDKSRSHSSDIFTIASIESEPLVTLADIEEKEVDIWVGLSSSKSIASLGEFIKYTCEIENRSDEDVTNASLINKLSNGLVYADKTANFKNITFDIKAGEHKTFSFVGLVDIDAKKYIKVSSYVKFDNQQSNISSASTKIKKDFDDKSIIMGQVTLKDDANVSLAGVRIYLDNGTFTHSDRYGKFHFQDVEPDSHVVSIDPNSISGRFIPTECKQSARAMGSSLSTFVNTAASHIQKVSFCLREDNNTKALKPKLSFTIPKSKKVMMPKYAYSSFKKHKKSGIFLWPKENFVPAMPSVKVAFMHNENEKIVLYLNGEEVNMLNFDGFVKSKDKKRVISKYRGVDIRNGDNLLEARISTKGGVFKKIVKRKIHLSTSPVHLKVLKDKSFLKADGKTPPVIAVQLFDSAGYHLRDGMVGTFSVEKPYLSKERLDSLRDNPLSNVNTTDKYTVKQNGIAYISLQATTTSGEVKLHFPFQNKNKYTKVWLTSPPRDWFIVGFAEGSVGYKTLNKELKSTTDPDLYHEGKVSFFAKGKVGSDALLSIAYDSGKRDDLGILEELEKGSEYTVYGDESLQQNEATSSKKLYLKIEKNSFYALFGDFDTGLNTHELSRYDRRINGVKSELKAETFEYSAFISQSETSFSREELRGDGTSGLYYLKTKPIVIGSQKVTIEVRDRYRDEVIISKIVLNPLLDYNIDYQAGTLYFKEPILSRDRLGNPQFIIVESEVERGGKKRVVYGGRGAIKGFDGKLELGSTILGEENSDDEIDTLYGFDAKLKATNNLVIDAEYATTKKTIENNNTSASAYLVELSHHNRISETKLYYKKQEDFFGFGQQSIAQSGTKKYGLDSTVNYWENIAIRLSVYGDEVLKTGDKKNVSETYIQYTKDDLLASVGYRYGKSNIDNDANSQIISTVSKRLFNGKVKLSGAYDYTLGDKSDIFKNRSFAEVAYFINQYVEIFANHEKQEGKSIKTNQSRAGVKGRPWAGATIESGVTDRFENDTSRLFGLLGINQNYQVNKNLNLNGSVEKQKSIKGEGEDFTAYSASVNYRKKKWVYNAKAEHRTSKKQNKTNLDFGVYTEVNKNLGVALGIRTHSISNDADSSKSVDAKFSLAYRPKDDFILINRLEYKDNRDNNSKTTKAVESLLCVVKPSKKSTISGHYGLKYIKDFIDRKSYDSLIDTVGFEFLYDITKKLELGVNGSLLHSYESKNMLGSFGLYSGYNLFKNTYIGLGYNFEGYKDSDFESLRNSEQGAYMKFRVKFDQESLEESLSLF